MGIERAAVRPVRTSAAALMVHRCGRRRRIVSLVPLNGAVAAMADLASMAIGPMAGGAHAASEGFRSNAHVYVRRHLTYIAHTGMNCATTFLCTEAGCANSNGDGFV